MGLIITNKLKPKILAPEANYIILTPYIKSISLFDYLLSHVTYVTAFNKGSNLFVTPAKSAIPYYMSKTIPNI